MEQPYRDEPFENSDVAEEESTVELNRGDFEGLLVAPSDWTIESLYRQIGKQIDLDPAFQRRDVWNTKLQSSLIESFFLNIPIPQILLASKKNERSAFIVIDGKQRLLAIKQFLDGQHLDGRPFKLRGMRILKDLEGKTWKDVEANQEQADLFLNSTQRATVLRGWNDEETLYEIFNRLNAGSVKLSPMELRMSLHPGGFIKYVIGWTEEHRQLHELLRLKKADKRMNDVELIIRYISFISQRWEYRGDLKGFLDTACKDMNVDFDTNDGAQAALDATLANMEDAIAAAMSIFKQNVCRKWTILGYETRFNRAIFDVIIGSLSNIAIRAWALDNSDIFERKFKELCEGDADFVSSFETSTKNVPQVTKRFNTWYSELSALSGINLPVPVIRQPA